MTTILRLPISLNFIPVSRTIQSYFTRLLNSKPYPKVGATTSRSKVVVRM